MQKIYSKDECAPDAIPAKQWLQSRFGVKSLYFDVIMPSHYFLRMESGDGSTEIFKHNGQFYVMEFSCGIYEEVYIASPEEVRQQVEKF
jgi:hypothetical protein